MTNREEKLRLYRGIHNAEKHSRFYGFWATTLKTCNVMISLCVLALTSSAIVKPVQVWSEDLNRWVLAVVALLTILEIVMNFSAKAARARYAEQECRHLANQWERLWVDRKDESVLETAKQLEDRLELVASDIYIFNDWFNKRFGDQANYVLKRRLVPQEVQF